MAAMATGSMRMAKAAKFGRLQRTTLIITTSMIKTLQASLKNSVHGLIVS